MLLKKDMERYEKDRKIALKSQLLVLVRWIRQIQALCHTLQGELLVLQYAAPSTQYTLLAMFHQLCTKRHSVKQYTQQVDARSEYILQRPLLTWKSRSLKSYLISSILTTLLGLGQYPNLWLYCRWGGFKGAVSLVQSFLTI